MGSYNLLNKPHLFQHLYHSLSGLYLLFFGTGTQFYNLFLPPLHVSEAEHTNLCPSIPGTVT